MFTYWRIFSELREMGETAFFTDPSFIRCYREWRKKHHKALAEAEAGPVVLVPWHRFYRPGAN